jgi:hypothetical protein
MLSPTMATLVNDVVNEPGANMEQEFVADMVSLAAPGLQRAARFDPPQVHPTFNEAEQVVAGGPAGRTIGVLNGAKLLSHADGAAAMKAPDVGGRSTATGAECWVNSVPTNVGSADVTTLNNGPWSTATTKAVLGQIFNRNACLGAPPGPSTLIVKGDPSDVDVAAHVRAHEDHHVSDHKAAFNSTALNWDIALAGAASSHQVFSGADAPSCEAAIYSSIGGSPGDIAAQWMDAYTDAIVAFHATPQGAPVGVHNSRGDPNCDTVTADAS